MTVTKLYVDFVSVTMMNSYLVIISFWFLWAFLVDGSIDCKY